MNEPQTGSPAPDDLADLVTSLRRQVTHLLLALIVISGTLATYLFYESHTMSVELDNLQPQAREIVRNYDLNLPNVQKFVHTLVAYGQTHPDYQPILKQNGLPVTLSALTNSVPTK
jgi:hypothetical protein